MINFNNDVITIYNMSGDKWYRTYIDGVDWQGKRAVTVSDKGLLGADMVNIFIDKPLNGYVKPKIYENSPSKSNIFTFKNGDLIVKGKINFDFSELNTMKKLLLLHDDVITIFSVEELEDHFEVGCK